MDKDQLSDKAIMMLSIQQGEQIIHRRYGSLLDLDIDFHNPNWAEQLSLPEGTKVPNYQFPGWIVVTNQRMIFLHQKVGLLGRKEEYRIMDHFGLEHIVGLAVDKRFMQGFHLNLTYDLRGVMHQRGFRTMGGNEPYYLQLQGDIELARDLRYAEIEEEKRRERVQFVIDFSFLKAEMAKGGIVVSSLMCPQCGGDVELPSSGTSFQCQWCGSNVQATDVFEKMKGLLGSL